MSDELPKGWATAPLAEIAKINPRHPKGLDDSMPISFVRMAALSEAKPNFESLEGLTLDEVRKGFTHFAEGDVLVRRVENLFALADQIEARLAAAQRQVAALTPSLLTRAFAGKLVPQDPTDESASTLLQRIRTATSSGVETTKRKSKTVKE